MKGQLDREVSWESRFEHLLPLFGHRNWIVIADAAYPDQANPGIETIFTGVEHIDVLRRVLKAIRESGHVRANIYLDTELSLVGEADAPGVTALRNNMEGLLTGCQPRRAVHEEIIARLDEAARLFRVLILKTTLKIPYTSVFLQLECGYWSKDAEAALRSTQASGTAAGT